MTDPAATEPYRVPAVVAAAAILDAVAGASASGLTQADIVRQVGISKSTAHNLLRTLESLGWLRRTEAGRGFVLGGEIVRLGALAAGDADVLSLTIGRLEELAATHGLTFAVARVTDPNRAEVVASAQPEDIHVGIARGSTYGPFDGAIGKTLLAAMEPGAAKRTIKRAARPAHTESTVTDVDTLLEAIEQVRRDGYATSVKEYRQNHAVAVGVHGREGDLEAILLTIGFPDQLTEEAIPSIGHVLKDVADAITAQCGGRGSAVRRAHQMTHAGDPRPDRRTA